jgi:hypothetical protein
MFLKTSAILFYGFAGLALALGGVFVVAVWHSGRRLGEPPGKTRRFVTAAALGVIGWLGITGALAASGVLLDFSRRPPPFVVMVAVSATLTTGIALSPIGTRLVRGLPMAALVGSQAFRFPLELLMHQASREGIMPVQMSYEGLNLDIVTGISAALLAPLCAGRRRPARTVAAWNLVGFGLLVNIVTIAVLSTPVFRYFGPDRLNIWVAYVPFVWLPEVMVMAALLGHILVLRKLLEGRGRLTSG